MHRELAIALRSRLTWIAAALAALLVGHGFVLAVDLFSASSRSALSSSLQTREMDPLAAIVRPTLGGMDLAIVIFGPLVAARPLSVEKERRTFGALCLAEGSAARVIAMKAAGGAAAIGLLFVAPVALFVAFAVAGGHLDAPETIVALAGEVLRAAVVVGASLAAAAFCRTLAQAAAIGVAASLTSWAIDAAEGFAALAWLGGASAWSIEQKIAPFGRGLVPLGATLWLLVAAGAGFALALVGGSFARPARHKALAAAAVVVLAAVAMKGATSLRRAYDWTEERRASLPPLVVEGLRAIPGPIELEVYLDRDDSRRRQLESDALQKIELARPDVALTMPLDREASPAEAERSTSYGRIVVRAAGGTRETRSTSRRELVTLLFEAAGRPIPEWSQPSYPGFPFVVEGARRGWLVAFAYFGVPLAMAAIGMRIAQRRTER